MRRIDELYLKRPFYGSRRMTAQLIREGYQVNRKRVQRLTRLMGIETIYRKPKTTQRAAEHKIYPYLLRELSMTHSDQVWCTDITYIPMLKGYLYLVSIMDWFSRFVLSWQLSNSLDTGFCLDALDDAWRFGTPEIFNSDQGCQFTSVAFTDKLKAQGVQISMDGRGRAIDNIWIERLWRSLKYEEVYLNEYSTVREAHQRITGYLNFYNRERPHQSLRYRTPAEVYFESAA